MFSLSLTHTHAHTRTHALAPTAAISNPKIVGKPRRIMAISVPLALIFHFLLISNRREPRPGAAAHFPHSQYSRARHRAGDAFGIIYRGYIRRPIINSESRGGGGVISEISDLAGGARALHMHARGSSLFLSSPVLRPLRHSPTPSENIQIRASAAAAGEREE